MHGTNTQEADRTVWIGRVDLSQAVLVVAEIGNNHEGDVALAERLIGLAAEAGAGAVKFQTIVPERLVASSQPERLAQLWRFCLSYAQFERLAEVAQRAGLIFLSTPFDVESARFLAPLVAAMKIGSGDLDYQALIETAAESGRPMILSSGMAEIHEIERAIRWARAAQARVGAPDELAVLHCVSSYPTQPQDANLRFIERLGALGVTAGYSDHTLGMDAAVMAVALGARIVEKHFTIDKHYSDFRDHALSSDPIEMKELVRRIRDAERMLGEAERRVFACEAATRAAARRSIVAARDLPADYVLRPSDLAFLRPGDGLQCNEADRIIGRPLMRPIAQGERFTLAHVLEEALA